MTHQPFTDNCTPTKCLLQLVHIDLYGPFPIPSLLDARYLISFIDHTARFTVLSFIKKKKQVFASFCKYKKYAQIQTSSTIKILRNDNGGDYISHEWEKFCQENDILHHKMIHTATKWCGRKKK